MEFIQTDLTVFRLTSAMLVSYGLVFLYHCVKKNTNNSLTIISGCLCVGFVFVHIFSSIKNTMDRDSHLFLQVILNQYLIWVVFNCSLILIIFLVHKISKTEFHYVTRYVFRCLSISVVLHLIVHMDMVVLKNQDSYLLWSLYSHAELLMNIFILCSVLIARKWSEVFRWLQLAHAR